MAEYELNRYSAYFRGWCQAFGEHDSVPGDDAGITWLFAERQIGLILPQPLSKQLFREVLGKHGVPTLTMDQSGFQAGAFSYTFSGTPDASALSAIKNILETDTGSHLFLASHFMYGSGARIITLSSRKPLSIIYKEIGPMHVSLTPDRRTG